MTKKDIVLEVAERSELSELTQTQIRLVIQAVLDHITGSLAKGKNIELRNFGVFKVKNRKGRMARNPKTGEKVKVEDRKVVVFKPGLIMKKKITGK
jgi:nucleoid DNA-binding protein